MSSFVKKYPRARVSRHATLDGWVIDLIQRETAKPKRVAATYASVPWAHRAAYVKLGLPVPARNPEAPAPKPAEAKPAAPAPAPAAKATVPAAAAGFAVFSRVASRSDAGICKQCNRPMRRAGTTQTDYPDTVLRQREGLCQSCCQREKTGGKSKPRIKQDDLIEDLEFFAETGVSREEAVERLNTTWETLTRRLYRLDRADLIERIKPKDPDKADGARKGRAA